jgi:phage terminase large subunit-like protein
MEHPKLFQKIFKSKTKKSDSWEAWKVFLAALFALELTDHQRATFRKHTGRGDNPSEQFREAFLVCGRRSGKSIIAALIAVYLSCFRDYSGILGPGEVGVFMIMAADRRQARTIYNYISAMLDVPLLRSMVSLKLKDSITLLNSIRIEIHTSSFRSIRGFSIIGAVCDELAFWLDDNSANPDEAVLAALRPGMASVPGALLLGVSSPYARNGALYSAYKTYFSTEQSDVLVWQAAATSMDVVISDEDIPF